MDNRQFIKKAKDVHGDRYTYTETLYEGTYKPVNIMCKIHGEFKIRPNNHLSGKQGCQKCSKKYRPTTEEFIERAKEVHGNKYDYSLSEYGKNNRDKVKIICHEHGEFEQSPANHISHKNECPICSRSKCGEYHKKTNEQFIEKAIEVHGDKYDYSLVDYINSKTKVKIICHEHGEFEQSPSSHIHQSAGCPICSYKHYVGGYGEQRFINNPEIKNNPAMLYLISIKNDTEIFLKIGITQKTLHERFTLNNKLPYNYEVINVINGKLYDMFILEQKLKRLYKHSKYIPNIKFNGYTECFEYDCIELLRHFYQ